MKKTPEEVLKDLEKDAEAVRRYIQIQNRLYKNESVENVTEIAPKNDIKKSTNAPKAKRGRPSANGINLKQEIFNIILNSSSPITSNYIRETLSKKFPTIEEGKIYARVRDVLAKELPNDKRFFSKKAETGKGNIYGKV